MIRHSGPHLPRVAPEAVAEAVGGQVYLPRRILGLAGYARAGKNTVASLLPWPARAFADPLRAAALALNPIVNQWGDRLQEVIAWHGWDAAKAVCPEVRRILQVLGTEAGRAVHGEDCWVRLAMADLPRQVVFTDVRFENELEAILRAGGHVVWVARGKSLNDHASENSINPAHCSYYLDNRGGLSELPGRVEEMKRALWP